MVHVPTGVSAMALMASAANAADGEDKQAKPAGDIIVTAAKTKDAQINESASATGLDLSLRETPQSVTVVDRLRIDDFALNNVNDLLTQTVGVTVERIETDRTEYTSRGFNITNFQVDGIGLPLSSNIQYGDSDTVLFERVDVVRGANAIMTGVGNPSATVNYLRKRPTEQLQANASAQVGSFDDWRLDGDVSGPLNGSGTIRARVIGAHEETDSNLDYYHLNRDVAAGLLALDVTPDLTATVGYSRQSNRADGVLWGALPLVYSDGSRINYKRSASTSAPWTYWDNVSQTAFGELTYKLGGDWSVRGVFTFNDVDSDARLLYASGTPDRDTGLGVTGTTGIYPSRYRQYLLDGYVSGSVQAFGRQHQLAFGLSSGWFNTTGYEAYVDTPIDYGDIRELSSFRAAEPDYPALELQQRVHDKLTRAYGAVHLDLTDRLKGVAGASAIWLSTTGDSYGVDQARSNSKVSPYAGLLYDLTGHLTAYASYTSIYNPQSQVDITNTRLDPAKGTNVEAGLKADWLDGRLYASAAWFRARQNGLASYAGTFDGTVSGPLGTSYYVGEDTTAKGVEFEVSGRVANHWLLAGGITHLSIKGEDGASARTFIPRTSIKLAATYQVPEWRDLKLGAQFRYQTSISAASGIADDAGDDIAIRQHAYATLDLLAGIRVAEHLHASLNVRNVSNAKYLTTLEYGSAYYAAPRSVLGTVRFDY